MRKRLLAGMLALILMLSVFAGCKPVYVDEPTDDTTADASAAASSSKKASSSATSSSTSSKKASSSSKKSGSSTTTTEDGVTIPNLTTKTFDPAGWIDPSTYVVIARASSIEESSSDSSSKPPTWEPWTQYDLYEGYGAVAEKTFDSLKSVAWSDSGTIYGDLEDTSTSGATALWGYGAYLEAAGAAYEYDQTNDTYKTEYIKALENVSQYQSSDLASTGRGKAAGYYLAYNAIANASGSEVYYDDNVWIAKEFIHAYELLGDTSYLEKAQKVLTYIVDTSWNDSWGGKGGTGGLEWMDRLYMTSGSDAPQKNTCINAPTADACLEMYEILKASGTTDVYGSDSSKYLAAAKKIYDWSLSNLMDYTLSDGVATVTNVYDKIIYQSANSIEQHDSYQSTYNYGMMIAAGARLYKATGDQDYLAIATALGDTALNRWLPRTTFSGYDGNPWESSTSSTPGSGSCPWMNSYLVEGYLTLNEVDSTIEENHHFIQAVRSALGITCTYQNYGDGSGWICGDWTSLKAPTYKNGDITVMNQAASSRVLFMLATYIASEE